MNKERYPLDASTLGVDLYRLAATILSSEAFRTRSTSGDFHHDWLGSLAAEFEREEIFRIIVAAAIWLRIRFDQGAARVPQAASEPVGTLHTVSSRGSKDEQLTLREACNKIVHATGFELSIGETESYENYLTGMATFTGTKQGASWQAELDMIEFVKMANMSM